MNRQFVDSDTGKPVEKDDEVKGYEIGSGDYVVLEPEEVASAIPESDKTLAVTAFVGCSQIDDAEVAGCMKSSSTGTACKRASKQARSNSRRAAASIGPKNSANNWLVI